MLKKIVGLSIVCMILLTVAAGGTWAYLSDKDKSSNNTIRALKLDLLTSGDGGVTYTNSLTQTLNVTNLKPSQSTPTVPIYLKNSSGDIYGSSLEIRFFYTESDSNQNGTPNMSADALASILQITTLDYNRGQDLSALIPDFNGNGYVDVQDLQTATNSGNHYLSGLAGINSGNNKPVQIQLMMRYLNQYGSPISNINDYQGDGINVTMAFTINQ